MKERTAVKVGIAAAVVVVGGYALWRKKDDKTIVIKSCEEISICDSYTLVKALNCELAKYEGGNPDNISEEEYDQIVSRLTELLEVYPELSIHANALCNAVYIPSSCKLSKDEAKMLLTQLDIHISRGREAFSLGSPVYTDVYYNSLLERAARLEKDWPCLVGIVKALKPKPYQEIELSDSVNSSQKVAKLVLRGLSTEIDTYKLSYKRGYSYISDEEYNNKVQLAKDIIQQYPCLDGIVDSFKKYTPFEPTSRKCTISESDALFLLMQLNYEISMACRYYNINESWRQISNYRFDQLVYRAEELIKLYPQFHGYVHYVEPHFPYIVAGNPSEFDAKYMIPSLNRKINRYSNTYYRGIKLVGNTYHDSLRKRYNDLVAQYPEYAIECEVSDLAHDKNTGYALKLNVKIQEAAFLYKNNKSLLSDEMYDEYKKKLASLIKENPEIKNKLPTFNNLDELNAYKELIRLNKLI